MSVRREDAQGKSEALIGRLKDKLGSYLLSSLVSLGDAEVCIASDSVEEFFRLLKLDSELGFNVLIDITAVDWMDEKDERFELVYHLMSHPSLDRLRVKVALPEKTPRVATITGLWKTASFQEREVFDMYGIDFEGHPDLRRILMYDEFKGHPLRKDYPVQGKQPRIQLRHPEVENTAVKMKRSSLVQIGGSS